ncbi:N-acetylneuraminate lyase-like [Dermacentor andersoni]|uniref:N-acetylneuraminate lyase-like n=1 Tax=Dermacentor andersoni TaxID=34620 RepID=UPI00215506EA|nr:N-acetylneuraminate lyase-like [Dermacentor andersoni]
MDAKIAKIKNYRGLCVAPFTPFDSKGHIDINLIDKYVSLLQKQSVTGAFVNGSTGEGLSLTVAERKKLADRWVEASKGKLDLVIVHVTAASIVDTRELATHAESLNVDAISILPPFYFRSPSIDHLIRYVEEVSKAAPNTPIIYYHIPAFTCVDVRMTEFLPEARRRVPALCGAKYSCSELSDLAGFLREDKADIKIFFGFEEMLLAALALGVTAAIGGTFTYQGHLAKKIVDLYEKGDLAGARHHQDKLKHGIDTLCNHGFSVAALKAAANKVSGLNFGDTRIPVCPLPDDKAEKLAEEIRALDILI